MFITILSLLIRSSLQIFGLALKTSRAQRLAIAALMVALDFHALVFRLDSTPFWGGDLIVASARGFAVLYTIDLLVISSDPQEVYRKRTQPSSISSLSLSSRISWAVSLSMSPRGIGWNHQAAHVPAFSTPPSPAAFIWMRLKSITTLLASITVLWSIIPLSGSDYTQFGNDAPTMWQFITLRFLHSCIQTFTGRWNIQLMGQLWSVFAVMLGLSRPEEWPDMSGDLWNAYTLRKGWGSVWHQSFRKMVATYGKFIARDVLGLDRGTKMSAYVQLWVAFVLSTIAHTWGDYALTAGALWFSWRFFLLQPIGIIFEDAVIRIANSYGWRNNTRWTRLVGYIWVSVWVTATCPIYFGGIYQARSLWYQLRA
ncbi:hypothetical protein BS47DRAFT_1395664 [Hydnum rufescens UP504]|uniref:Wax synthase domain-containing protein n=1 Tax=Hydnum rufescens UP504 TaxID=1448309 RepID=A0A9P6ARZ0_9AGAM|nr:hypothetical protein BS47DRAFT_1395664 [Hydnum rufescens UP504]